MPPPQDPSDEPGPGGFPRHPGTPPSAGDVGAPAQPSSIRTAVRLMWAGAAVSVVSLVVTFTTLDTLKEKVREQLEASDANVSQSTIDAAYTAGIAFGVFGAIVGALLWLWMAWKNGQGRSWARIVASILGGINLLSTIFTVVSGNATPAAIAVALINLLLAVVILVLLWRKESSDFYAATSAAGQVR